MLGPQNHAHVDREQHRGEQRRLDAQLGTERADSGHHVDVEAERAGALDDGGDAEDVDHRVEEQERRNEGGDHECCEERPGSSSQATASSTLDRSVRAQRVCSWLTRDSVTPRT